MNLDQTTVPLEPRRTSGCFDVAVNFFGRNLPELLKLWSYAALPAAVLVYIMSVRSDMDFRLTLVALYAFTWPLGVLVTAGTSRAVFGERFSPRVEQTGPMAMIRLIRLMIDLAAAVVGVVVLADVSADMLGTDFVHGQVEMMWYALLLVFLTARFALFTIVRARGYPGFWKAFFANGLRRLVIVIGPLLILFPMGAVAVVFGVLLCILSIFVFIRKSFLSESTFLSSLDEQLHGKGVNDLVREEGSSLFFRGLGLLLTTVVLALVVFFTVDQACNLLLSYPILAGRLDLNQPLVEIIEDALLLLSRDSRCLFVLTGTTLLVYPIARMAWLFCYIDLRVRRDCWDMELKFQQEARHLEGSV